MKRFMLIAACVLVSAFAHAEDEAPQEVTLLPGAELPLQGTCGDQAVSTEGSSGRGTISTLSCAGSASQMVNLNFSDGTYDRCLYIDNNDVDHKSYFIPVQTVREWLAFKVATLPAGVLYNKIKITYGCEAAMIVDACSKTQSLPRGRAGATLSVASIGTKRIQYVCSASNSCGAWTLASSEGSCAVNGICGAAATQPSLSAPASSLCLAGTATEVTSTSQWEWECKGLNGGVDASCFAPMIRDGVCGSANNGNSTNMPTTNLCSVGTASSVEMSPTEYLWTCAGDNGGETASCSAVMQGGHWKVESTACAGATPPTPAPAVCAGAEGAACAPLGDVCATTVNQGKCQGGVDSIIQMKCQ